MPSTKPAALSFEKAAAVPTAAMTALQGLSDKGGVQPGMSVLIHGASGGVGAFRYILEEHARGKVVNTL